MTTGDVLGHHLQAFGSGSVDELLKDYTADSKFFTPDGVLSGLDTLRGLFTAMIAELSKPGTRFDLVRQDVVGDVAFITWKAETADNAYDLGTDTFVVRDGKIAYQTFAAKITPKK